MVGIEIKEDREQVREIGGIGKKVEVGSVVKPEACRWHIAKKKQRMKIEERHQSVAGLKLCRFEGMQCLQDATMEYAPKASSFSHPPLLEMNPAVLQRLNPAITRQRWRNAQVCCTERQGRLCAAIGRFPEIGLPLVTPKSSILIVFCMIPHLFGGIPIYGNPQTVKLTLDPGLELNLGATRLDETVKASFPVGDVQPLRSDLRLDILWFSETWPGALSESRRIWGMGWWLIDI